MLAETADLSAVKAKIASCSNPQELYDMARYLVPYSHIKQELDKRLEPESRKSKELTKLLDSAHAEFEKKCRKALVDFDRLYMEMKNEINRIRPKFRCTKVENEDDARFNMSEWNRFVDQFGSKYGYWFYDIRLRHDPLDDMNCGSISIRETKSYVYDSWYPGEQWADWVNLPYGAKLFSITETWWDLELATMLKTGRIVGADIPSKEFRQYVENLTT